MKVNSLQKNLIFIFALILLNNCSHQQVFIDIKSIPEKSIQFKNLKVNFSNDIPYYILETYHETQRVALATPKMDSNKGYVINKTDTGQKALILENTKKSLDNFVYSIIDIDCNLISDEHKNLSDEEFIELYKDEDIQWSMINDLMPNGVEYGQATFDDNPKQLYTGYATKSGIKPFSNQIAVFTVFNFINTRYLVSVKLFSQIQDARDIDYLKDIIKNITVIE